MTNKSEGIDYFSFDTGFFDDVKIEYILEEIGPISSYIYIRFLVEVYSNSYYIDWNKMYASVFGKRWKCDKSMILKCVNEFIDIGLFDKDLFNKYSILTSYSIQERYVKAVTQRKGIYMLSEYLMLDPNKVKNGRRRSTYGDIVITNRICNDRNATETRPKRDVVTTEPRPNHDVVTTEPRRRDDRTTTEPRRNHDRNATSQRQNHDVTTTETRRYKVKVKRREEEEEEIRLTPLSSLPNFEKKPPASQPASQPAAFFKNLEEVREGEDQDPEDIISKVADIRIQNAKESKSKKQISSRVGLKKHLRAVYEGNPKELNDWLEEIQENENKLKIKEKNMREQRDLQAQFDDNYSPKVSTSKKMTEIEILDQIWECEFLELEEDMRGRLLEEAREIETGIIIEKTNGSRLVPTEYAIKSRCIELMERYRLR